MVFLTDGSIFEYETKILMWRQVTSEVKIPSSQSRSSQ